MRRGWKQSLRGRTKMRASILGSLVRGQWAVGLGVEAVVELFAAKAQPTSRARIGCIYVNTNGPVFPETPTIGASLLGEPDGRRWRMVSGLTAEKKVKAILSLCCPVKKQVGYGANYVRLHGTS